MYLNLYILTFYFVILNLSYRKTRGLRHSYPLRYEKKKIEHNDFGVCISLYVGFGARNFRCQALHISFMDERREPYAEFFFVGGE